VPPLLQRNLLKQSLKLVKIIIVIGMSLGPVGGSQPRRYYMTACLLWRRAPASAVARVHSGFVMCEAAGGGGGNARPGGHV
jgi:hypothetical protein